MFNYSNNIEEVPTALNNDIKTEYNDFLNETTTATFRKEGLSLKKSLESVPGAVQKYEVLYNNILSVYAALPTSFVLSSYSLSWKEQITPTLKSKMLTQRFH